MTRETELQDKIRLRLGADPDIVVFRNDSGAHQNEHTGQYTTYGLLKGSSDLICCLKPHGRMVVLEVKVRGARTERRRLERQTLFIELIRSFGGFGAFVFSLEDAVAAIERAKAGLCG